MLALDLIENCQITGVIWGVHGGFIVHARDTMAAREIIRDRLDLTEERQITGVIWGVLGGFIVHARGTMAARGIIRDRLDLTEERQITGGVIWWVICRPMTVG